MDRREPRLFVSGGRPLVAPAFSLGTEPDPDPIPPTPVPTPTPAPASATPVVFDDLASTMVLHGAVGVLAGAAAAPRGSEAVWAAAGFVVGATIGQVGIVGLLAMALWRKTGSAAP